MRKSTSEVILAPADELRAKLSAIPAKDPWGRPDSLFWAWVLGIWAYACARICCHVFDFTAWGAGLTSLAQPRNFLKHAA